MKAEGSVQSKTVHNFKAIVKSLNMSKVSVPLLVAGTLLALLLWLLVPPLVTLIENSFRVQVGSRASETMYSLGNYIEILTSKGTLRMLTNTLKFAIGSAIAAIFLGVFEAWISERTNTPFKGLLKATAILSLSVPHILYTISWILILGNNGPINKWIGGLFGIQLVHLGSVWTMSMVEGFLWSPLIYLLITSSLRNFDIRFEEASIMSGGSTLATLRRVTLPLMLPAILSIVILILIRAFQAFEVPTLMGLPNDFMAISTNIFVDMKGSSVPKYGPASAMSTFLLMVASIGFYYYYRQVGQARRFQVVTGKGYRKQRLDLGKWKYAMSAFVLLDFTVKLIVPLGWILWTSLPLSYGLPSATTFKYITASHYMSIITYPKFLTSAFHTIMLGVLSATIIMLLALLIAWIVERTKFSARRGLDYLSSLPLVFPAIVLGVGILEFYIRLPLPIYGSMWILLIGYTTLFMPYGMRYIHPSMIQLGNELDESAEVCGASPWRAFRTILAPLLKPAFWAGWLFVFLLVGRELTISVFLATPGFNVTAVQLFDLWNNGQIGTVASFGILWTIIMSVMATIFLVFTSRHDVDRAV